MDLRERIIAAATELFQKSGLRFTVQEVAAALNISKKTIYTVYASTEELLLDMIDGLFADIHRKKSGACRCRRSGGGTNKKGNSGAARAIRRNGSPLA